MPSSTTRQVFAMAAAAHGKGTLGIPQGVAKEFNRADARTGALSRALKRRVASNSRI